MPIQIEPAACSVVEHDETRGLDRQIRDCESINHIITCWGHERNSLSVLPTQSIEDRAGSDLDLEDNVEASPVGFTFQLYHFSQPGKWTKQWITLTESGQVFATSRLESLPVAKGALPLSHLADADIYIPTQSARHFLKPPGKFCYAIKNLQGSGISPHNQMSAQYFSTDNDQLAHRFHQLVREWRGRFIIKALTKSSLDTNNEVRPANSDGKATTPAIDKGLAVTHQLSLRHSAINLGNAPLVNMTEIDQCLDEISNTFNKRSAAKMAIKPDDPRFLADSLRQNENKDKKADKTMTIAEDWSSGSCPLARPARREDIQNHDRTPAKPSPTQHDALPLFLPAEHTAHGQEPSQKAVPHYRPPRSSSTHYKQQVRKNNFPRHRNPAYKPLPAARQCIRPSPSQYGIPIGPPRPTHMRPSPLATTGKHKQHGNPRAPTAFPAPPRHRLEPRYQPMSAPQREPMPPVPPVPPHLKQRLPPAMAVGYALVH